MPGIPVAWTRLLRRLLVTAASSAIAIPVGAQYRVAGEPSQQFGDGLGMNEELREVLAALTLSNGTVVVADGQALALHYFAADGRGHRRIGRRGGGPGEFQSISWIQRLRGDSLAVWDWRQRRLSVFTPTGSFARQVRPAPALAGAAAPAPLALLEDGTMLAAIAQGDRFPFAGRTGEVRRDSLVFARTGPDGALQWRGTPVPSAEVFGMPFVAGRERFLAPMSLPLGRTLHWALAGDTLVFGVGDSDGLSRVTLSGTVLTSLPERRPRRPVAPSTAREITDHLSRRLRASEPMASNDVDSALLAAMARNEVPIPSRLPAHGRIVRDPVLLVWVQDPPSTVADALERGGAGARSWRVLDESGRERATVDLPDGVRLLEVGHAHVLVLWRDGDGFSFVRRYALSR